MEKLMISPRMELENYLADEISLETMEYVRKTPSFVKFLKKIKWYLIFAIPAQMRWKKFQNNRHRVVFGI
jgi:hypothetical protein